jgi:dihydroorotase
VLVYIKNGYVIDPGSGIEGNYDILIKDNLVHRVIAPSDTDIKNIKADRVIDAAGMLVIPGLIDLHAHLREPGYEYKETILTGSMAAAAGGFTTICAMPNTRPALDMADRIEFVLKKADEALINVYPIGAITLNQEGKELTDIAALIATGAVGISEDGKSLLDSYLYTRAMEEAARLKTTVFAHCEDKSLAGNGVINAGKRAEELGLEGISNAVEDIIVARDLILAKETGVRLHLCHCSTKGSTEMLKIAKGKGLKVTGETCPHYFTLSDEDIPGDDSNYKMNPPLRSPRDVKAIIAALKNDILDVIATDHAPHSEEEKSKSMAEAPFGIVGLETAVPITYTELVRTGILTYKQMVEKMSLNPARILGIDRGCIGEGKVADIAIINPDEEYIIDKYNFYSKGRNTPFHGRRVYGRVRYTLVSGKVVYEYQ